MHQQPISEFLVIRNDGRLHTCKYGSLYHPIIALRLPRGLPPRYEWVEFRIT